MKAAHRRLLRSSRAARTHLIVTVALGCATAGVVVAQAAVLATVIDRVVTHGAGLAGVRGLLIVLAALAVARALTGVGFELSGRLGAARAMSELRGRLAAHLLLRRPGGLAGERTGELAAIAVSGVDGLEAYFARYLPQVVLAALVPVGILAYLAPVDLQAAAILAVTVPVLAVFMVLVGKAAEARLRARFHTLSLLGSHFLDVVRGLETLRAHARDGAQVQTIGRIGDRFRRETLGTLRVAFLSALVLELVAMLGVAMVAATVGLQLAGGHLDLRSGLTVLILAPELYLPLRLVGQHYHASADGMVAAERIFEVLDSPATVSVPQRPRAAPDPGRDGLRLEGVAFAYPERPGRALDGVDLELAPGELVALTGPSGAGKSTIAALALRLADPTAGRVTCGGIDLREVDPGDWRRRVAWVPQRTRLFAGTVADNVRLGRPDAGDAELWRALEDAGAAALASALPDGLRTRVGEGGRVLSAGEAQRLAVARAFLRDAPLLVLDEPTAHLDAGTAAGLGEALERLARGRTTLLIAHSPALAARADRVAELRDGRIAAIGDPVVMAA